MKMNFQSHGATKGLSDFIANTNYETLSEDVIKRTKMCFLDWIGSAYSGKGSATDMIMHKQISEMGGKHIATLVGHRHSTSPTLAALYNGTISAVMEIDDVHEDVSLHPSIGIIPAALSAGEDTGATGRDLIVSVVVGYEIAVRIARSAGTSHYQFWHSTGTCNTFGAASAVAKLLNLDQKRAAMSLGLAGTQAAGLWESASREAAMAKHLHSGKACFNGILAAFLSREGYKGSLTIVEGKRGFLAASSGATGEDLSLLTKDLGKSFLIIRNIFKRHACCRGCFEGIEGVRNIIANNNISPQEIDRIELTTKPMRAWMVGNKNPRDIYEAKFSLPFCIALVMMNKDVGLYQFNKRNLNNPKIKEFMRRVSLISDPQISVRAKVEVSCKDGSNYSAVPVCESLNLQEVKDKFIRNMLPILKEKQIRDIVTIVENLEDITDIRELTGHLKHRPRRGICHE